MRKKAMNYVAQVTKQELSTEKVELSVADDVSKTKAFAEDIMQQISKIKAEIKEDNKLNSAIDKEIKERIKSSKNIASKAEQFDNEINKAYSRVAKVTQEANKAAKQLGVDASAIKGFDALIKIEQKLVDQRRLTDELKNFAWI
jgi:septal ring factor EnvC (AmiA/AmiB activator)